VKAANNPESSRMTGNTNPSTTSDPAIVAAAAAVIIFTTASKATKYKSWRLLARRICSIGWGKFVKKWLYKIALTS